MIISGMMRYSKAASSSAVTLWSSCNHSMVYGTAGGLIVNDKAQVLDQDGNVIEHLYAAGELTCVQVLDTVHFSAGENLSWNVYSGRIAGTEAAKEQ